MASLAAVRFQIGDETYRVPCIAQQTDHAAGDIRVRLTRDRSDRWSYRDGRETLLHPQPPWTDLLADLQMSQHLTVQVRVGSQEVLHRQVVAAPGVVGEVSLFSRKETVVRQQFAAVAGRQDDLVPFAFLATPVLQGAILGVVDQSQSDGVLGLDIRVETARIGRLLLRMETDDAADGRADAIRADNQVVTGGLAICERDDPLLPVDIFALRPLALSPLRPARPDRGIYMHT